MRARFPLLFLFPVSSWCIAVACGGRIADPPGASQDATQAAPAPTSTSTVPGTTPGAPRSTEAEAGPPPALGVTADAYCTHVEAAFDALLSRCCSAGERAEREPPDFAAERVARCRAHLGRPRFIDRGSPACWAALDAVISGAACTTVGDAFGAVIWDARIRAPCGSAYEGIADLGQPCLVHDECKPGLACVGYDVAASPPHEGRCAAPAAAGHTCGAAVSGGNVVATFGAHPECAPDADCFDGACKPRLALGAKCVRYDEVCVDGAICIGQKCVAGAPGGPGTPCERPDNCIAPMMCNFSLGAPRVCEGLLSAGRQCDFPGECAGTCSYPDGGPNVCVSLCGSR